MLKKAIELNPNYAIARQYYSKLLDILNEKEEALEEKEPALNWLERAMEEGAPDIPGMNCSPDFNILRDKPRFLVLIEKMGLTPYQTRTTK